MPTMVAHGGRRRITTQTKTAQTRMARAKVLHPQSSICYIGHNFNLHVPSSTRLVAGKKKKSYAGGVPSAADRIWGTSKLFGYFLLAHFSFTP